MIGLARVYFWESTHRALEFAREKQRRGDRFVTLLSLVRLLILDYAST